MNTFTKMIAVLVITPLASSDQQKFETLHINKPDGSQGLKTIGGDEACPTAKEEKTIKSVITQSTNLKFSVIK